MNEPGIKGRASSNKIFHFAGLLVIAASFALAWLIMDFQIFRQNPLPLPAAGTSLVVKPGSTLKSIAHQLEQQQIVSDPFYLIVLARYLGLDARIKAGEFQLQPGITPEQLLHQLADGKVVQHTITLIEGETFAQMMQRVSADKVLTHELENTDAETVMNAIGAPGLHPEGRFLPETYHFPRGTTDIDYLRRAFLEMEAFLEQSWQERDEGLPLKTPYDALILASIVEKETAVVEERPLIAGVFVRRLRKGMKLQTDPTVIYGMGDSYKGDIRYRDLRRDTPYNTYTRYGLPPTPIALPGKDAILAVLHPAPGEALYFVARGDGSHKFSSTLKQHNRAVDRYQRKR
ncbi:MAG: endolytic transglycosylase MltG [Gammaproteobacteria bacterium]|nr:MAG: endolytic transglycosylase MltG [Gammaproteobacteria bacterium]